MQSVTTYWLVSSEFTSNFSGFLSSLCRMKIQRAAGCCCVRTTWSPLCPSSRSSSSIHTCWGWALRVNESLSCLLACFPHWVSWRSNLFPGVYEPQACSSQKMMRVFAFASSLIEILALGLQTYNRARYRQLVKRVGHIIRSVHQSHKLLQLALLM